ncbi:hypothetical protein EHM69_12895, partial [candidate division KSB1 bacterium]
MKNLFEQELQVINIGLPSFKETLDVCGVKSVQMDWRPPLSVSAQSSAMIAAARERIETANAEAVQRIMNGKPFLTGLGIAMDLIPGMKRNLLLHAGPPISWDRMCRPVRGAGIGALI